MIPPSQGLLGSGIPVYYGEAEMIPPEHVPQACRIPKAVLLVSCFTVAILSGLGFAAHQETVSFLLVRPVANRFSRPSPRINAAPRHSAMRPVTPRPVPLRRSPMHPGIPGISPLSSRTVVVHAIGSRPEWSQWSEERDPDERVGGSKHEFLMLKRDVRRNVRLELPELYPEWADCWEYMRDQLNTSNDPNYATNYKLHEIRKDVKALQKKLYDAVAVQHFHLADSIQKEILELRKRDPWWTWTEIRGAMDEAIEVDNLEAAQEFVKPAAQVRTLLPEFGLEGLWYTRGDLKVDYKQPFMMNISYHGDTLVGHIMTRIGTDGPQYMHFIEVDLSPKVQASRPKPIPAVREEMNGIPLQRFVGRAKALHRGKHDERFEDIELIMIGNNNFAVYFPQGPHRIGLEKVFTAAGQFHKYFFGRTYDDLIIKHKKRLEQKRDRDFDRLADRAVKMRAERVRTEMEMMMELTKLMDVGMPELDVISPSPAAYQLVQQCQRVFTAERGYQGHWFADLVNWLQLDDPTGRGALVTIRKETKRLQGELTDAIKDSNYESGIELAKRIQELQASDPRLVFLQLSKQIIHNIRPFMSNETRAMINEWKQEADEFKTLLPEYNLEGEWLAYSSANDPRTPETALEVMRIKYYGNSLLVYLWHGEQEHLLFKVDLDPTADPIQPRVHKYRMNDELTMDVEEFRAQTYFTETKSQKGENAWLRANATMSLVGPSFVINSGSGYEWPGRFFFFRAPSASFLRRIKRARLDDPDFESKYNALKHDGDLFNPDATVDTSKQDTDPAVAAVRKLLFGDQKPNTLRDEEDDNFRP